MNTRMRKLALAMLSNLAIVPACADYSTKQFEEALRGYLWQAHGNNAAASHALLRIGSKLKNAEMLRDATHAAIRLRDARLAMRAGELWYTAGGGIEALQVVTRLQIGINGLESSRSLLRRLAENGGPASVYTVIRSGDKSPLQTRIMRESHPLHLRNSDYYAYLSLLMVANNNVQEASQVLAEQLNDDPTNTGLLLVALLIAEEAQNDSASLNLAQRLSQATGASLGSSMSAYNTWKANLSDPNMLFPSEEGFAAGNHAPRSLLLAGAFLISHGAIDEALETFRKVPRQSPEWPYAVTGQIDALREIGDNHQQILDLLATEVVDAPKESKPHYILAYAEEVRQVEGHAAAYEYLSGQTDFHDNLDLLFALSVDAERLEKIDEAERILRHYIELAPQSSVGYNALSYLFAVHSINLDEALWLVNRALSIEPTSPAIIDTHGWVLYRRGDLAGAISRLEQALNMMPEPHAEIMAHLGEALWEAGQYERAKRIWQAAMQVDPNDYYLLQTLERYADQLNAHEAR